MNSDKYLKLIFNKKIANTSIEIIEYFTPYTYEGLTKKREREDLEASNLIENSESQDDRFAFSEKFLNYFNINAKSELNTVDNYHLGSLNKEDWKNSSDNQNYTSIFDYWSEVCIISEMNNIDSSNHKISNIIKQELITKMFISEIKKDLSILLRLDKDINAWNNTDYLPLNLDENELDRFIKTIKLFFVNTECKSKTQVSFIIEEFLDSLSSIVLQTLYNNLISEINEVCKSNSTPYKIKQKIIILLKKHLGINFNELAFKNRKLFYFKLKRKYNLHRYSSKEYREFAYFPEILLNKLTDLVKDILNNVSDFNELKGYFKNIPMNQLGWYYYNGSGCFAIMKTTRHNYFALSGYYDYYNNKKQIKTDKHWVAYDAMEKLADEINSKVFNNSYHWAPLTNNVLTYYSHQNLNIHKLELSELLDHPITLIQFINISTNGWMDVASTPAYRLFSCCEKKLIAQLHNKTYRPSVFFIRKTPCHLCMMPMKDIINKFNSNVYALKGQENMIKDITSNIKEY